VHPFGQNRGFNIRGEIRSENTLTSFQSLTTVYKADFPRVLIEIHHTTIPYINNLQHKTEKMIQKWMETPGDAEQCFSAAERVHWYVSQF
jgi:hypothetical protein